MTDEERAQWLDRALDTGAGTVTTPEDAELADLLQLATELQQLGPRMALLARADESFDPAFALKLKNMLLAQHPARAGAAPGSQPARTGTGMRVRWWRRVRALVVLGLVAVAIALAVLVAALRGSQPGAQVAVSAPTATSMAPRAFGLLQRGAARLATAPRARPRQQTSTGSKPPAPRHSQAMAPATSAGSAGHTPGSMPTKTPAPVAAPLAVSAPFQPQRGIAASAASPLPGASTTPMSRIGLPGGPVIRVQGTTYVLPGALALPRQALQYILQYPPLTRQTLQSIVATFSDLHPGANATGAGILTYSGTLAQLTLDPSAGTVTYSSTLPPAGPVSTTARAGLITAARAWLRQHHLYPAGVSSTQVSVTSMGATAQVAFAPTSRISLAPGLPAPFILQVQLNARGHVLGAHYRWPTLSQGATVRLVSLATAIHRHLPSARIVPEGSAAAGSGNLRIRSVQVAYQVVPAATGDRLEPVYVLTGQLLAPSGHLLPFSQVLLATSTA